MVGRRREKKRGVVKGWEKESKFAQSIGNDEFQTWPPLSLKEISRQG